MLRVLQFCTIAMLLMSCRQEPPTVSLAAVQAQQEDAVAQRQSMEFFDETSGLRDAEAALVDRLVELCGKEALRPNDLEDLEISGLLATAPTATESDPYTCARTRFLSAFDGWAGEAMCDQFRTLPFFIGCIVQGQFLNEVWERFNPSRSIWSGTWDSIVAAQVAMELDLFNHLNRNCNQRTQVEVDYCAEDLSLDLYRLTKSDVGICTDKRLRIYCYSSVAYAAYMRDRLILLF